MSEFPKGLALFLGQNSKKNIQYICTININSIFRI